ncbi:hypothetical protein ABND12_21365 [Paenibacillus larvae]
MNITLDLTSQLKEQLDKDLKESITEAIGGLVVEDRVMTKKEVAAFFQVSIPTLEAMMFEGLPYFKRGYVIRFLYSQVVGWIKTETERNSTSLLRK